MKTNHRSSCHRELLLSSSVAPNSIATPRAYLAKSYPAAPGDPRTGNTATSLNFFTRNCASCAIVFGFLADADVVTALCDARRGAREDDDDDDDDDDARSARVATLCDARRVVRDDDDE